jgi:parvulin-like peptidyl-prolyl isomerase
VDTLLTLLFVGWVLAPTQTTRLAAGRSVANDPPSEQDVVIATVDGEPIHSGDVQRLLKTITGGKEVNPAALPWLQAQVLAEIIDRRLVLAYAKRTGSGATQAQIDAALADLTAKLASQGRSLGDYLKQRSLSEAGLRRQIAWDLTWPQYLARYLTDQRLQAHFQAQQRQFDGTQVSVSHILLRPKAGAGPQAIDELLQQAHSIRQAITSGELSFAAAAQKYSAAPSAKEGGRLGLIARHGAMVEAFSRAAFELDAGQISQPIVTRFGVHLIRCDEIRPGNKQWSEVRNELQQALARQLIDKLSALQHHNSSVEFTGKAPYFKPGTRELVVPH